MTVFHLDSGGRSKLISYSGTLVFVWMERGVGTSSDSSSGKTSWCELEAEMGVISSSSAISMASEFNSTSGTSVLGGCDDIFLYEMGTQYRGY